MLRATRSVCLSSSPYLAHPEVGTGSQAAPLLTRLPGSQQRSGHQGSSGHSRATADRAGCQSPASPQSCGNRAGGPQGSVVVCSPQRATFPSTLLTPTQLPAGDHCLSGPQGPKAVTSIRSAFALVGTVGVALGWDSGRMSQLL